MQEVPEMWKKNGMFVLLLSNYVFLVVILQIS